MLWRFFSVAAFCAWLFVAHALAQSNIIGGGFYGDVKSAAYSGPGDVVASNWLAWGGFRAFNLSKANAGTASFDWKCGASTGTVHVTTGGGLNSTDTSNMSSTCGATTISLTKLYDQTGNAHHWDTCISSTDCPVITLSGIGTGPAIKATVAAASTQGISASSFPAQAQPFTYSMVVVNTSGTVSEFLYGSTSGSGAAGACGFEWATSNFGPHCSVGAVSAVNNYYNGASSDANVNGTTNTGAGPGTLGIVANSVGVGFWPSQSNGDGSFAEFGVNTSSTEIYSSLVTNQRTYWGF